MTPDEQAIRNRATKRRASHDGWVPVWREDDAADIDALLQLVKDLRTASTELCTVVESLYEGLEIVALVPSDLRQAVDKVKAATVEGK